jgi:hypothetical protein
MIALAPYLKWRAEIEQLNTLRAGYGQGLAVWCPTGLFENVAQERLWRTDQQRERLHAFNCLDRPLLQTHPTTQQEALAVGMKQGGAAFPRRRNARCRQAFRSHKRAPSGWAVASRRPSALKGASVAHAQPPALPPVATCKRDVQWMSPGVAVVGVKEPPMPPGRLNCVCPEPGPRIGEPSQPLDASGPRVVAFRSSPRPYGLREWSSLCPTEHPKGAESYGVASKIRVPGGFAAIPGASAF